MSGGMSGGIPLLSLPCPIVRTPPFSGCVHFLSGGMSGGMSGGKRHYFEQQRELPLVEAGAHQVAYRLGERTAHMRSG
jgi:hypothetical protein